MFKFAPPLTPPEHEQVAGSKEIIYDGFRQALASRIARRYRGWVDVFERASEKR